MGLRIAVCVKQVPEVSELSMDPATRRLQREGVPALINPFDRRAVLEALRLREEHSGSVVAITMGPPQAAAVMRECLGLGVDRAVHLCDARFAGADTLATSRALARAVGRIGADLVLVGRYSIDAETGQVGPEVAALLDMPFLGGVRRLALELPADPGTPASTETSRGRLLAECEIDEGALEVECSLPVVASCTDRWKTRVPIVVPDDDRATTVPVEVWSVDDLGDDARDYGAAGSPTWVAEVQTVDLSRARQIVDATADPDAAVDPILRAIDEARSASLRRQRPAGAKHQRRADPRGCVLVVAESSVDGSLRPVTFELLGAADAIATELGLGVAAVLTEPTPESLRATEVPARVSTLALAQELGAAGADCVLVGPEGRALAPPGIVPGLISALAACAPRMLLAPATTLGRDALPELAARLGLGLTGDAIGVEIDRDGRLRQLKPAFGGMVVAPVLSRTHPELVTLRPGALDPIGRDERRPPATVVALERTAGGVGKRGTPMWTRLVVELDAQGLALESAPVVVCLGFGLGHRDRVPEAEALARALGGAVGATRRVCDSGWVARQLQIGLSGRSVAPAAYLGLGVRGSFNHVVGLRRVGTVIAVNRDPEAEVFAAADLGVIGDAPSILRALSKRCLA